MNFPYRSPFEIRTLAGWAALHNPSVIGMNDSQYAWYARMIAHSLRRDFNGIPIEFLDAPKDQSRRI